MGLAFLYIDTINLIVDGVKITKEVEVADAFNSYFVKKIDDLKNGIDPNLKKDPCENLAKKQKNEKAKFTIKIVSINKLKKFIKKMKSKKSSGVDGLTQEQLIMGANELAPALATIINESIKTGVFPENWKEAQITPVLKKGDTQLLSLYVTIYHIFSQLHTLFHH